METSGRDTQGRFVLGRKPPIEELKKKEESIKQHYKEFVPSRKLREQNPYIYNSWRSIFYTQKGKKIGCTTEEWRTFENFYRDVSDSYEEGLKFHRLDTTKPFSKENFIWVTPEQAGQMRMNGKLITLEYKGEILSLRELAVKYNQGLNAICIRYQRHKNDYTTEEIIFGRKTLRGSKKPRNAERDSQDERNRASKLISAYKCKDKKHGTEICDITVDWMVDNIFHKSCIYCGDTELLGCDRINNEKGHIIGNVVPCCYSCNCVRNNTFTHEEMLRLGKTIREIKQDRRLIIR